MNGLHCACFELEGRHFSARSPGERRVWLRALFNCKVRIMNDAPVPSDEDLDAFRLEISEMHEAWCSNLSRAPTVGRGPLLARSKQTASQATPDGDKDPLPLLAPPDKFTLKQAVVGTTTIGPRRTRRAGRHRAWRLRARRRSTMSSRLLLPLSTTSDAMVLIQKAPETLLAYVF